MSEKKQWAPKEYIEEDLRSIVKAAALMSTAMNEGRIVEANGWLEQIKAVSRMRLASAVFMVRVIREKAPQGRLFRRMKGVGAAGTRQMQRKAGLG